MKTQNVQRTGNSTRTKCLWKLLVMRLITVRAAENYEKSVELLRRRKILAKLLENNVGPEVIETIIAASECRRRSMFNMGRPIASSRRGLMTWVRDNQAETPETRKIVPARKTRHDARPYGFHNRRAWRKNHAK